MLLLGAHVSIAGGLHQAFAIGVKLGCTAIQIFTKNATRWNAPPLSPDAIARFLTAWRDSAISTVVAHDSYLINLGTPDPMLRQKSQEALLHEVQRCVHLRIPYLVMHPGAHVGAGETEGLQRIAAGLDWVHEHVPEVAPRILLETTAGQGTNVGYRFEHLAAIFDMVHAPDWLGVCLDTCHIFAAGYDLRTDIGYAETMRQFETVIGLNRLQVLHLNDSQKGLGSRIDRHVAIGNGAIGIEGFRRVMNDPRLAALPKIIETPKGADPIATDQENMRILRELLEDSA